jgi:hypothetical protein
LTSTRAASCSVSQDSGWKAPAGGQFVTIGGLEGVQYSGNNDRGVLYNMGDSWVYAGAHGVLLTPAVPINNKLFDAARTANLPMAGVFQLQEPGGNMSTAGVYSAQWDMLSTGYATGSFCGWMLGRSGPNLRQMAVRGGMSVSRDGEVVNSAAAMYMGMSGSIVARVEVPAGSCSSCAACISTVATNMAPMLASSNVSAVAARFNATCRTGVAPAASCASVSSAIVSRNSSSLGKRPGLLCHMLGLCTVLAGGPPSYDSGVNGTWRGNGSAGTAGSGNNTVKPTRHLLQVFSPPPPNSPPPRPPPPGSPPPRPPPPYSPSLVNDTYWSPPMYNSTWVPSPPWNSSEWYGAGGSNDSTWYSGTPPGANSSFWDYGAPWNTSSSNSSSMWYPSPPAYYGSPYVPVDPVAIMAQLVQDMQYMLHGGRGEPARVLSDGFDCPPTLVASNATGILSAVDLCSTDGTLAGPPVPGVLPPAGKCGACILSQWNNVALQLTVRRLCMLRS